MKGMCPKHNNKKKKNPGKHEFIWKIKLKIKLSLGVKRCLFRILLYFRLCKTIMQMLRARRPGNNTRGFEYYTFYTIIDKCLFEKIKKKNVPKVSCLFRFPSGDDLE